MGYVEHVVRRGLSADNLNMIKRAVSDGPEIEIPKWGASLIFATFVIFLVGTALIEYTLEGVVAILAMVENPSTAITVSPSSDEESAPKNVKEDLIENGPTITLVHQKPITSSIRGTIRHLVSIAGGFSRWRAILSYVFYQTCLTIVCNVLMAILPRVPGQMILATGLASASLANLHAAWTHKVISMPTSARFFQRIPPRSQWKRLALPAAIQATIAYITVYLIHGFAIVLRLSTLANDDFANYSGMQWTSLALRVFSLCALVFACGLFLILPAHVTLIRVEASILPEDMDTIVPFDRSFGGKVVPTILGGTGCIGFLDAWKSFNWEARRRIIKLYIKIFLIVTAVLIIFAHVLVFETWAIMGPAIGKFIAQAKQEGYVTR